jgi:hypothetical protein
MVTRPTLIFASDPINFYTEFGYQFLLFNQQQCFIYSTASFLSKLRAKKVEKLCNSSLSENSFKTNDGLPDISKLIYQNQIQEPGTTISGGLPIVKKKNKKKKKKKKKKNDDRSTLDFFDMRQ